MPRATVPLRMVSILCLKNIGQTGGFMKNTNLMERRLSNAQYTYMESRSTETAIHYLVSKVEEQIQYRLKQDDHDVIEKAKSSGGFLRPLLTGLLVGGS